MWVCWRDTRGLQGRGVPSADGRFPYLSGRCWRCRSTSRRRGCSAGLWIQPSSLFFGFFFLTAKGVYLGVDECETLVFREGCDGEETVAAGIYAGVGNEFGEDVVSALDRGVFWVISADIEHCCVVVALGEVVVFVDIVEDTVD